MSSRPLAFLKACPAYLQVAGLLVVAATVLALANCGSTVAFRSNPSVGSATVSISDPPSCAAPSGSFKHVFISIVSVQAHLSGTATDNSPGWQELATQLLTQPVQVDLFALPAKGACLLAQLGSTSSLPVGDYQQIRLLLVANNPPSGPVPASNACASLGQVFNCVVDSKDSFFALDLSSQANTGLKVPPGQMVGGPIHVEAGKTADINVDFNACASIVPMGGQGFRLRPTLTAGQISSNATGISGKVVDSSTKQPIAGALVALEQADSTSIDRIKMQAATDANGNFNFCPLPMGAVFDVVADAVSGSVAYNATVVLNVPGGTALSGIPLVAETGTTTGPGTIQGFVTALSGTTGANIDVALSALQTISVPGGGSRQISIPLEKTSTQNSTPNVAVQSSTSCPAGSPAGAFCAQYTLVVPASNPSVGTFSAGSTTFSTPATGDVLYTVEAAAFKPSAGTAICSPSSQTTNLDSTGMPLKVTAGATTTAKRIDFSGCS